MRYREKDSGVDALQFKGSWEDAKALMQAFDTERISFFMQGDTGYLRIAQKAADDLVASEGSWIVRHTTGWQSYKYAVMNDSAFEKKYEPI